MIAGELRADQFDVESIEHARFRQRDRQVERGLSADGRQNRVGALLLDDLREHRDRHRLDVGAIGQFRIGHDGRGIRIDQDEAQAFLAQRLERLRARVVELAGLPDDDRAGANQQNRFEIFSKRHFVSPIIEFVDCAASLVGNDLVERFGAVTRKRFDQFAKSREQISRIMRTRRRLRMILHREKRHADAAQSLDGVVVEIDVRQLGAAPHRIGIDREAMILRGDFDPPVRRSLTG